MKEGWDIKRIKDIIIEIKDGGTPSRTKPEYFGGPVNWCVVKDILPEIYSTKETLTELGLSKCSAKIWPINSVIISLGATIGQVGIAKIPVATKQGISGIVLDETLLKPEFLVYFLNYKKEFIQASASGTTIKEIRPTKLSEILEIPVPPLPEQQRIVSIIDEAFEAIDKAIENTQKNLQNAKELFESYLNNVFEKCGEDWEQKTLKEVCAKITDGTHQTPKYFDDGVIFLSSRNVTSGKIDWDNIKYIDEKQHLEMHKRVAPRVGDILLAKNGTTGVAAIVDRDLVFDIYVSLAHIRVLDQVTPEFMLYFINSPLAKKQFNKRLKGSGVPNLHLEEIREVSILFPKSKSEQKSIVEQLDAMKAETQRLELMYNRKICSIEELKKSVLNKAFAGEL